MANIFENKDRRVIPNWRSFRKTVVLGELNNIQTNQPALQLNLSIDHYIEDWNKNKTIPHAGDLISAAIVNDLTNNPYVSEAAKFVLSNSDISSPTLKAFANKIIHKYNPNDLLQRLENISLDEFDTYIKQELVWTKIKAIKKNILNYPYNPILYIELARNYSILGQGQKAINAMKTALHFSSQNRFILRCATRLFAHNDDLELAHDILRKNPLTKYDPWLISAEIAIATLRDRNSRFVKSGIEMVNSKNLSSSSITELASSLGTLELLSGNHKKSRGLFKSALISPNDNTLAQIEWASSKDAGLIINPATYNVKHTFEALALDNFHNNNLEEALNNTFRWFLDMPFSKRPVMLGSHIASSLLHDHEKSRAFLKAGLISHPNDAQIINNLVYSLALENNTKEALDYLNKVSNNTNIEKTTEICLKATRGLIYYRCGIHEEGRKYYMEAIEDSKAINSPYYGKLALLNFTREEILIKSEFIETLISAVGTIPNDESHTDIIKLKDEVIELYNKSKNDS